MKKQTYFCLLIFLFSMLSFVQDTQAQQSDNQNTKTSFSIQDIGDFILLEANWIISIIIIGFLIVILLLYYSNLQKNKVNKQLLIQNKEINNQKEEIATQAENMKRANSLFEEQNGKLKAAYKKLKELDYFKENMANMIVHDLKNPLNSVIGLSESEVNDRSRQMINQSGKQMLNMVMNILDVYKLDEVRVKLDIGYFKISDVLKEALHQVELLVNTKALNIQTQIHPQLVAKIDFDIISRVLVNLLTNAVKFTQSNGTIKIYTALEANFIKIFVADNGNGIPFKELHRIFDKYKQLHPKKSGTAHSTGLGLSFCKSMVEAHGGKIGVISKLGEGATFWFTVPINEVPQAVLISNDTKNDSLTNENKFVLTEPEKELLQPFLGEFQLIDVYEISHAKKILQQIDSHHNENLRLWKVEMENALYSCNEEKYRQLIYLEN